MRITLESDYALRILTAMAEYKDVTDAKTIANDTSVTIRFALKILHKLVQGDLVQSYKGVNGGYMLRMSPDEITLKRVIELIDGPIAIARCLDSGEGCSLNCDKSACDYHHIFDIISIDLANKLNKITIKDVINKNYHLT
ncbi:MAG: Rrf2 family transcriptional regulator [Clostridia bacterium]|nr:Rrf2 family transcriptional regulator [Clostridia bacterium]